MAAAAAALSAPPFWAQVSEESLLRIFSGCGSIMDSRMCGDPNSALRFAFIEFDADEAVSRVRAVPLAAPPNASAEPAARRWPCRVR